MVSKSVSLHDAYTWCLHSAGIHCYILQSPPTLTSLHYAFETAHNGSSHVFIDIQASLTTNCVGITLMSVHVFYVSFDILFFWPLPGLMFDQAASEFLNFAASFQIRLVVKAADTELLALPAQTSTLRPARPTQLIVSSPLLILQQSAFLKLVATSTIHSFPPCFLQYCIFCSYRCYICACHLQQTAALARK